MHDRSPTSVLFATSPRATSNLTAQNNNCKPASFAPCTASPTPPPLHLLLVMIWPRVSQLTRLRSKWCRPYCFLQNREADYTPCGWGSGYTLGVHLKVLRGFSLREELCKAFKYKKHGILNRKRTPMKLLVGEPAVSTSSTL